MVLQLYNTLTRKKELFKEIKKGKVTYYFCGPTPYNYVHLGNLRAYIFADLLRRYLKYKGYQVFEVMNFTDVDDKTIKNAKAAKQSLQVYTQKFIDAFIEDFKLLNIELPEKLIKATDHIPEMIDLIKKLEKNGLAYKSEDGSIYFSIKKFKNYGKLALLEKTKLRQNADGRMKNDEYEKEDAKDFALWKAYHKDDGNVFWETKYGKGRPGWHIECSAMSTKYLGDTFDIHGGGVDLIFPHHTNEIAQSEGATNKKFVNYWVHNAHLIVNGEKMSKSKRNFFTLRDLIKKGDDPKAIRYELLSTHYRAQLDFREENLKNLKETLQKFNDFLLMLDDCIEKQKKKKYETNNVVDHLIRDAKEAFENAMDNDLNISEALAAVFTFMHDVNKIKNDLHAFDADKIKTEMQNFDSVLGIMDYERGAIDQKIETKIQERERARKKKDFKKADLIRNELLKQGIILEDTADGARWKKA
ncbi:cysteine--tRNA ligase [Candidatus Woesearchaeota archaeon]|nr:cysteine--tRNA ligase [Candidatus Woesearchaeota archaeon]